MSFTTAAARRSKLGTATLTGASGTPPTGAWPAYNACPIYKVAVSGLANFEATCAVKEPTVAEVGTVIMFGGSEGMGYWSNTTLEFESWIDTELATRGYRVIQNKWASPGWIAAPANNRLGPAVMAARSATLIRKLHAVYCATVNNLILVGHSGGAGQSIYAITRYGCEDIVKSMCFSGGAPFSAIAKTGAGIAPFYDAFAANLYDTSYGYPGDNTGPAFLNLTTDNWPARWTRDQTNAAGHNLNWGATRSVFLSGINDFAGMPEAAIDLMAAVRATGTEVTRETYNGGHSLNTEGLVSLAVAVRNEPDYYTIDSTSVGTSNLVSRWAHSKTPSPGVLLVANCRCTTVKANIPTPTGWRRDLEQDNGAATGCLIIFSKVATEADTVTETATITNKELTSGLAKLTTSVAHSITIGHWVTVKIGDASFDDTRQVLGVTATTITYNMPAADVAPAAASGTATTTGPGIAMVTSVSSVNHVEMIAVHHLKNAVLDRSSSIGGSVAAGGTITVPATAATTAAKEWAMMGVAEPSASVMSSWGDGFVAIGSTTKNINTAFRTLLATETLEGTVVSSTAISYAAGVVSYKAS